MPELKLVPLRCANCGRSSGHLPHCPNSAHGSELAEAPPDLDIDTTPAERGWINDAEAARVAPAEMFRSIGPELKLQPPAVETHCRCGTEHTNEDPELRLEIGGVPLVTMSRQGERDHRFSWPRVCLRCGAVYCKIWQPLDAPAQ